MTIAALYVETGGCYTGLAGVDAWDIERDARLYSGPHPVVAHPPCQRWGKFATGAFKHSGRFRLGDDEGCFEAALHAVRQWGGILEHPAGSRAWKAFGLKAPKQDEGWVSADWAGGWTCQVEQGHYGHPAQKPTWLYANGVDLPSLLWGKSSPQHAPGRSARWLARAAKDGVCVLLSRRQRAASPEPFRDLLLGIARTAQTKRAAA